MEMTSYSGRSTGIGFGTGMMRGTTMSIQALHQELGNNGERNLAYEQDHGDSFDSLSHSSDADSLVTDDFNSDDSNTEVKKVTFAHSETTSIPNQAKPRTKPWDVFRVTSEDRTSSVECWNICFRISKIVFCFILFVLVLVTSIISKMSFLLMTANIFPSTPENNLKTLNGTLSYPMNSTDVRWIWGILITITAPYLFTVLKYLWVLILQRTWPLKWSTLIAALVLESLHTVGLCIFVAIVIPSFDPLTACGVSFCISPLPGILKTVFPLREPNIYNQLPTRIHVARVLNLFAFFGQAASICLWVYYIYRTETSNSTILISLVILSPPLISISWWENFVPQDSTENVGNTTLRSTGCEVLHVWIKCFKKDMIREKVRVGIITNLWKILLTLLIIPALHFGTNCNDWDACIKTFFFQFNGKAKMNIVHSNLSLETQKDSCYSYLPFVVSIINVVASAICYKCVKVACKILAQKLSYAFPVVISTPIVIGLFLGIYSELISLKTGTDTNSCAIPLPVWTSQEYGLDLSSILDYMKSNLSAVFAWFLGFFSFLLISNHIWSPDKERLIATDRIFVRALYSGVFLDQSLLLNRRRIVKETHVHKTRVNRELPMPNDNDDKDTEWSKIKEDDTPMIYMCATMWHESEVEMVQILKSIFRQDCDQCARRNLQLGLGIKDADYYEFEAHIFFDDAFESRQDIKERYEVNKYVKKFVESVETAARSVTGNRKAIDPPIPTSTPYGGRLEWQLPGENKLIAHLKDKTKIRHRKRWSQVMYMYYFLAHKLAKISGKSRRQKRTIAENTFLLALDGDVDFQPNAVQLLVDRMRKNPNVGAACGRIHPIGSGPMVWYQQFEYAVSHWLQKAAENVMGCVLCSPGCFSLFRGSALMDDNVMAKYTTLPTEARHYVQYDQGEDRWLCTLMLQQGYKVEYVAASDAMTYAPEGFYEFYNQRRRWSPSTMANIIDLLMDWKNVTRKNEDITKLYILYQMFLMICSILTPGTIFLMVLGAISMAFPSIPPFAGMILNLMPVGGMIILCFVAKPSTQLAYAAVVSVLYSLLMMVVLVGILLEAVTAGLCSVTTLFLLFVVGVFFLSAVIHPKEFFCVLHGFIYFLSIPSMSMLLMIYSLGNLHVVSWGTRETVPPSPQQPETINTNPARSPGFLESVRYGGDEETDYLLSCGNFIRCCPVRPFNFFLKKLDIDSQKMTKTLESDPDETKSKETVASDGSTERSHHEHLTSQTWMDDDELTLGDVVDLDDDEKTFWEEFIPKYLKPLSTDKEHEKKMHQGLIELRNKVCLAFLLMNALFVTIVYVLTEVNASTKHALSVKLPCTVSDGPPGRGYIEPISFAFTAIFGIMLFLQFICMLMHRMSTFIHIIASIKLDWKRKLPFTTKEKDLTDVRVEDGLEYVRELQSMKEDDTISIASTDTTYDVDSYIHPENKSRIMWKRYTGRLKEKPENKNDYQLQFVENLIKVTKASDDKNDMNAKENNTAGSKDKLLGIQKLFKPKNDTKNDTKINEIKRRATALYNHKKKVAKSRWKDYGKKVLIETEKKKDAHPEKVSKVEFATVTEAAVANDRRKRLEVGDSCLDERRAEKEERETSRRVVLVNVEERETNEENSSHAGQNTSVKTTGV